MRHALLAALLVAPTIPAASLPADPRDDPATARRATAPEDPATALSAALRRSRLRGEIQPDELIAELVEIGEAGVAPAVRILLERTVPPTTDEEAPQRLSEPQRELLATALEAWPAQPALDLIDDELLQGPTFARAWAAMHVWGAAGRAEHLERAVVLASSFAKERKTREPLELALQQGVTQLLRRRPEGHARLAACYARTDESLRLGLILGVGETRDARASAFFAHVLRSDPAHAAAALAQVQLIGRAHDDEAHSALCAQLRDRLDAPSANLRNAAVRALGVQRDWTSVERILGLLDDSDESVRASAEWALKRATGLAWRDARSWRAWYETESHWRSSRMDRLIAQLTSSSPKQVVAALQETALHPLFGSQTAPWAVESLSSISTTVRRAAVDALGKLDCPSAYPALIGALEDPEPSIAEAAHVALGRLSGRTLPPEASAWRQALLE